MSEGILILLPWSCLRGPTLGAGGAEGFKKYQIDGDDKQNRIQVKF